MAVVIQRSQLTPVDKEFIKDQLTVQSNTDPPVTIKPFQVFGEEVRLPFAFYRELREFGKHADWPEFPNDAKHTTRFTQEYNFKGTLRPYQEEAWKEFLPILKSRRAGLVSCHTGWGKTAYTSWVSSRAQLVTLILYHISPLGRSWPKTYEDFTDAVVCHIGHDVFNPDAQVYIATVGSALSESFPLDPKKVGVLVIDEAHAFCSPKRIFAYLRFEPKYVINLTATPVRADGMGALLGLFHGRLKVDEKGVALPGQVPVCIEKISDKPFTVYKCNSLIKPRIKSGPRGLDWKLVKDSMITKPEVVKLICDWVTLNPHKKILIPVVQINQMDAIAEELVSRGENVETMSGSQSSYNECRVLVAIDKKCGLGFDDQMTCCNYGGRRFDMIILSWTIKDRGSIEQVCGRIRGANGTIVDPVFNFATFRNHYKGRAEWYRSRNGTIIECKEAMCIP